MGHSRCRPGQATAQQQKQRQRQPQLVWMALQVQKTIVLDFIVRPVHNFVLADAGLGAKPTPRGALTPNEFPMVRLKDSRGTGSGRGKRIANALTMATSPGNGRSPRLGASGPSAASDSNHTSSGSDESAGDRLRAAAAAPADAMAINMLGSSGRQLLLPSSGGPRGQLGPRAVAAGAEVHGYSHPITGKKRL
jgi:hypothetical protein